MYARINIENFDIRILTEEVPLIAECEVLVPKNKKNTLLNSTKPIRCNAYKNKTLND